MNTPTLPDTFRTVRDRCTESADTVPWASALGDVLDNLPTSPSGTLRAWMDAHVGQTVHTVQHGYGGTPWVPGPRIITEARATFALLDTSRRTYAGTHVIASDANTIVFSWDDGQCFTLHTVILPVPGQ